MPTKIISVADTHSFHRKLTIEPCDFLIHAGDIGWERLNENFNDFFLWFKEQPAKYKIFVAGNHDRYAQLNPQLVKEISKANNIIYLEHEAIELDGIKFFGSPYTPRFGNWAFMKDHGWPMYYLWQEIPKDTNVLITHGPPWGVLDMTPYGENVGCVELRDRLKELKKLKLCTFGHIHNGFGYEKIGKTQFVNAAICDEQYGPNNKPVVTII